MIALFFDSIKDISNYFRQKFFVPTTKIVITSKRPKSIAKLKIYLAVSDNEL